MEKMTRKAALSLAISALSDNAEAVEVLTKMVASLDRKPSTSASRKPSANQVENEGIKQEILTLLATKAMTIPEMLEELTSETAHPLTSQRVSALLTQLKREGMVVRSDGRDAIFALVTDSAEEVEEEA